MAIDANISSRSSGVLLVDERGVSSSSNSSAIEGTLSLSSSICSTMSDLSISSLNPLLTRSISLLSLSSADKIKGIIENSGVFSDVEKKLVFKTIDSRSSRDPPDKLTEILTTLDGLIENNSDKTLINKEIGKFKNEVILSEVTQFIESNSSLCFSAYEADLLLKEFAKACENPGSDPKAKKLLDECLEKLSRLEAPKEADIKPIKQILQAFLKENISFKDTLSIAFHEEVKAWKAADKAGRVKIVVNYFMNTFFPPLVFAKKCYDFIQHMAKNPEQWVQAKARIVDFFKNPSLGYEARKSLAKTLINIGISGLIGVVTAAIVFGGGISIPFIIAFSVMLGMGLVATTVNDKQENKSFVVTLAETSNVVITNTCESIFSTLPNPGLTPFMRTFAMATNFTEPTFQLLGGPVHDVLAKSLTSQENRSEEGSKTIQNQTEEVDWSFPEDIGFCGFD